MPQEGMLAGITVFPRTENTPNDRSLTEKETTDRSFVWLEYYDRSCYCQFHECAPQTECAKPRVPLQRRSQPHDDSARGSAAGHAPRPGGPVDRRPRCPCRHEQKRPLRALQIEGRAG